MRVFEDSHYFNAGSGSILNKKGEMECDAMIMNGKTLNTGICIDIIYTSSQKELPN